jgi:hypothetical protein
VSLDELRALEQAAKRALLGAILTKYDGATKTWRRATLASDAFEDVERAVAALDGLLGRVAAAEAERDALLEAVAEFERLAVRHEKAASRAAFLNDQYENEGVARGLRKALEVIEKRGKR